MDSPNTTKVELTALVQRALALKHKLKVHDSMPRPETHEEIAKNDIARWDLEDELRAIEILIQELRMKNVDQIKSHILKKGVKKTKKNV